MSTQGPGTEGLGATIVENDAAVDRALHKLRWFMAELDSDERHALAALIAPGVEQASAADAIQEWSPEVVRRWLIHPGDRPPTGFEAG